MEEEEREEAKTIRWKQRFENLERAYRLLKEAVGEPGLSRLAEEGLIQRFEYTFELSWKTVKDYLEAQGMPLSYPREVLKEAFRTGLLTSGEPWIDMLERRNELAHTYDESRLQHALSGIRETYFPAITELVEQLRSRKDP